MMVYPSRSISARTGVLKSAAEAKMGAVWYHDKPGITAVTHLAQITLGCCALIFRPASNKEHCNVGGASILEHLQGWSDCGIPWQADPRAAQPHGPPESGSHGPAIGRPKSSSLIISQFESAVSSMSSTSAGQLAFGARSLIHSADLPATAATSRS
jgi:hypothetical protein